MSSIILLLLTALTPAEWPSRPFPESHHDTIDGISVHYRKWDLPQGRLKGNVLLLHGFCGSTFSWRKCVDTLVRAGYRVCAVDLPPFGYSDRRPDVDQSPDGRARLVWNLLDEIVWESTPGGRPFKWVLAGHSMGGGVVAAMARQEPERITGLVLVDAAVGGAPASLLLRCGWIRRGLEAWGRRTLAQRATFKRLLSSAYGRAADSAAVDGYYAPLRLSGTAEAIVAGMAARPRPGWSQAVKIAAPTVLIWGDNDGWVPLDAARKLQRDIPGVQLRLVLNGGHIPMETEPAQFNRLLLEFLDVVAPGR